MNDEPEIHSAHCRAARALLGWTQVELATEASVGRMTVKRYEAGEAVRPAQAKAIRGALEGAGVAFVEDGSVLQGRVVRVGVLLLADRERQGEPPRHRVVEASDEEPTAES